MLRSLSRLVLVLIAAAVIALCAGGFSWDGTPDNFGWSTPDTATVDGFSWDGTPDNFGWSTPDTATVDGSSVDSSGSATVDGFSWDGDTVSAPAVAG